MKSRVVNIYGLAFTEGALLMCMEISAAKLMQPYFGDSLVAWVSALSITFLGVLLGYFVSRYFISNNYDDNLKTLIKVSALLVFSVLTAVFIFDKVAFIFLEMSIIKGIFLTHLICFFFPFVFLGMVPIFLIENLQLIENKGGVYAGNVFFISSVGGISSAFLTGFFLIPELGSFKSVLYLTLFFALCLSVYSFNISKYYKSVCFILIAIIIMSIFTHDSKSSYKASLVMEKESLNGKFTVLNFNENNTRNLMINNLPQTIMNLENGLSMYNHVKEIIKELGNQTNSKILIIGSGGGNLAKELAESGYANIMLVEVSADVITIAEQHFGLPTNKLNIIIDDGRHFINKTSLNDERYDAVIIDAFGADAAPYHLLTVEAFSKIAKILNPDGKLMGHFPVYSNFANTDAFTILKNTLSISGFCTKDVLKSNIYVSEKCNKTVTLKGDFFTDDKPILDMMLSKTAEVNMFRKGFLKTQKE